MKYLKHYEELNLRNLFKRKNKDDEDHIDFSKKGFSLEELKELNHKYIDSWEKGENDDMVCIMSQSFINDIPKREGLKLSDKIEKIFITFIDGVKPYYNTTLVYAILKGDDYEPLNQYQYKIHKGKDIYNIPSKYLDRWKLECFNTHFFQFFYEDEENKLDAISNFFNELPSILIHPTSEVNLDWPIRNSLEKFKKQKRAKVLIDNYDEIESYFTDLVDLSSEHHIMKNKKGGIVANFTVSDIIKKSKDPYKKGESRDSFRLNKAMVTVMDALLEVESRVSEILPDVEFDISVGNNKITVFIS